MQAISSKTEKEKLEYLLQLRYAAYIDHNILRFRGEKAKIKTPKEAMLLLDKEQKFWISLENNVKWEGTIKAHEGTEQNIERAKFEREYNSLDKLYKVAKYAFKNKIIDERQLVKDLTADKKISEIHDYIIESCYKHNCKILTAHCNEIASGRVVEHEGHKFDSVDKYLEHWKANVDHKLIPIKQINVEIQRLREKQKEFGHEFGGPGL